MIYNSLLTLSTNLLSKQFEVLLKYEVDEIIENLNKSQKGKRSKEVQDSPAMFKTNKDF